MRIYEVEYWLGYNGEPVDTNDATWGTSKVLARDGDDAIAKLRKSELGKKTQVHDDDDKPVRGKFDKITDLRIDQVKKIAEVDLA